MPTRRQMLQMGAAALGIAKLPAPTRPAYLDWYEDRYPMEFAGVDLAQGASRTVITWGRWNADGTLTITRHEYVDSQRQSA